MAGLSTHILDTSAGRPGADIRITLHRLGADTPELIGDYRSNSDGRIDQPLLTEQSAVIGQYELTFYVGDYFRRQGNALAEPAFLDDVMLRFAIADPAQHYHVPLLISPWAYSTYRGS